MKGYKFFDVAHAERYLSGTVIRVSGEPVYVDSVGRALRRSGIVMEYASLRDIRGRRDSIDVYDPAVDLSPVPLGLVNYPVGGKNAVVRAARTARRAWKIGLCAQNLAVSQLPIPVDRLSSTHVLTTPELAATISGDYPSLAETRSYLSRFRALMVAFSRRFYLTGDGAVGYALAPDYIGTWTMDGTVRLYDQYFYLRQQLEKDGATCA